MDEKYVPLYVFTCLFQFRRQFTEKADYSSLFDNRVLNFGSNEIKSSVSESWTEKFIEQSDCERPILIYHSLLKHMHLILRLVRRFFDQKLKIRQF
jgi:hypothetical protein